MYGRKSKSTYCRPLRWLFIGVAVNGQEGLQGLWLVVQWGAVKGLHEHREGGPGRRWSLARRSSWPAPRAAWLAAGVALRPRPGVPYRPASRWP